LEDLEAAIRSRLEIRTGLSFEVLREDSNRAFSIRKVAADRGGCAA
jgi:hypothetical protein